MTSNKITDEQQVANALYTLKRVAQVYIAKALILGLSREDINNQIATAIQSAKEEERGTYGSKS